MNDEKTVRALILCSECFISKWHCNCRRCNNIYQFHNIKYTMDLGNFYYIKGESQWITGIYFLVIQKFSVRICWHIFFRKRHSIIVKRKYFRKSNPPFSFQAWFTSCVALCGCLTLLCLSFLSCKVEKIIVSPCKILLRITWI